MSISRISFKTCGTRVLNLQKKSEIIEENILTLSVLSYLVNSVEIVAQVTFQLFAQLDFLVFMLIVAPQPLVQLVSSRQLSFRFHLSPIFKTLRDFLFFTFSSQSIFF